MAVLYPHERREWWAPQSEKCYYCGSAFQPDQVLVFWSEDASIVLHEGCARELGVHLIGDAREAALGAGEKPWASRAAKAAGASLKKAEGVPNA